jgi:DNA-binding response OmpR family regulator
VLTSRPQPHVLLVEDQPDIAANLFEFLEARGFVMDLASDGVTGLHLAVVNNYDVIVLDIMLPGIDGLTLCQRLRNDARKSTPILMLTAKDTLADKLAGFSSGTDDYLVKPFDLPELEARLRALTLRGASQRRSVLTVGDLSFDTTTLDIRRDGRTIELNHTCRRILETLMREYPKVVWRERLERELWGDQPPDSDSLRSHIYALRLMVDRPFEYPMIVTVHRTGYRLVVRDEHQQ